MWRAHFSFPNHGSRQGCITAAHPKFSYLATTMSNNNPNELDMDQFDAITMELANAGTFASTTGAATESNSSSSSGNRVAETALGEVDLDAVGTDESEEEIDLDAHTAGGSLPAKG